MTRTSSRLTPDDWLKAGLRAIAKSGPEALKAEPLASQLNVSKGSFYWHFRDVPAYHETLLSYWEDKTAGTAAQLFEADKNPVTRLRSLAQTFATLNRTENAVRSWANAHKGARKSVNRVDAARLKVFERTLAEIGISNPEMARILYAAAIGMNTVGSSAPKDSFAAIGSLVDLVLALR